jgi:Cu+-exporting ATPase
MQVRDEVCGMRIEDSAAVAAVVLGGKSYHFCSERCRRKFVEHPEWYVNVEADPGSPQNGDDRSAGGEPTA